MGFFGTLGNIAAGIQGSRLGKKQMQLGKGMIDEAQALSAAYERPVLDIPEMTTPTSTTAALNLASGRRFSDMPGLSLAQNQIGQSTAQVLRALQEMGVGSESIGAVGDIYAQNLGANRDLSIQNQLYKDKAEQDYINSLFNMGEIENRNFLFNTESGLQEFDWNQAQPYTNAQNKAAMLETLGRTSQWEGLKTKMGSWAKSFQGVGSELDDSFSKLFSTIKLGRLVV